MKNYSVFERGAGMRKAIICINLLPGPAARQGSQSPTKVMSHPSCPPPIVNRPPWDTNGQVHAPDGHVPARWFIFPKESMMQASLSIRSVLGSKRAPEVWKPFDFRKLWRILGNPRGPKTGIKWVESSKCAQGVQKWCPSKVDDVSYIVYGSPLRGQNGALVEAKWWVRPIRVLFHTFAKGQLEQIIGIQELKLEGRNEVQSKKTIGFVTF